MRNQISVGVSAILLVASLASAQAPAPAPGGQAAAPVSVVVAKPTYATVVMEVAVNKPAAEVWARIGKYCDIGEWARFPGCTLLSGKDGEVGTVRSIGNEVLVAKTEFSYTYAQTPREGRPYDMYHGTVEARPVTLTTTKIIYTLMFDNSMLADDAAREADKTRRRNQFTPFVENMKILAEGGTLPPAPARGGGGGRGGAGGAGGGRGGPGGGVGAPGGAPGGGAPGGGQRQ